MTLVWRPWPSMHNVTIYVSSEYKQNLYIAVFNLYLIEIKYIWTIGQHNIYYSSLNFGNVQHNRARIHVFAFTTFNYIFVLCTRLMLDNTCTVLIAGYICCTNIGKHEMHSCFKLRACNYIQVNVGIVNFLSFFAFDYRHLQHCGAYPMCKIIGT